ncbi:hypothetical protein [Catenuloplanes japonicus]|uniref:hypothetical protein n=1 Tax=Catenuloplanes japonicus TaxID=33876 RepID=UPI0005255BB9|nr:hypothetical protein [Catenuloplanes japonicus]
MLRDLLAEGQELDDAAATSAWPGLLPAAAIRELAAVDRESASALLWEITRDARHAQQMAWAGLVGAMLLFATSLALSAYLVQVGASAAGVASIGGGALTVVTILLTGRMRARQRP